MNSVASVAHRPSVRQFETVLDRNGHPYQRLAGVLPGYREQSRNTVLTAKGRAEAFRQKYGVNA
jgi:hypothetical protein